MAMLIRVLNTSRRKRLIMAIKIVLVSRNILILILRGIIVLSILVVGLVVGAAFKNRHLIRRYLKNAPQSIEMEWRHVATDESEVEDESV
jgi:cell division protein FtsL